MSKIVKVQLQDAGGAGVANVRVKATGCAELVTSSTGHTQFLVDQDNVAVTIEGKEVYSSATNAVPGPLVFKQSGSDWKLA